VEFYTQLRNYITGVRDCSMTTLNDNESVVHHLILNQKAMYVALDIVGHRD